MNLKDKTCLCVDNGLFPYIAEALCKDFGTVLYFSPWASAFPDDKSMQVGVGLKGVKRVDWWLPYVDEADLIVFPDTYYGPDAEWLAKQGKRVWGSRMAEELELHREDAKVLLAEAGVPIGEFAVCEGIDELRLYLQKKKNVFVKFSFTRGDKESFFVENYELAEPELDDLEHRLGPRKNKRNFIVEGMIDPACEIAYDGYTVDGQYPESAMWGVEVKGKCYAGLACDYEDIPAQITDNNARVAPLLKKWKARSWFGMETRVTKGGKGFVIDPLVRFGNPPGALCTHMYTNLAEIFWGGANGEMVQPVFRDKVGVQLQIYSEWSEEHWQPIHFPPRFAENVRLQYHTVIDGVHYVVPTADKNPSVGSIVASGGTIKEAVERVEEIAKTVKGPGIKIDCRVLQEVQKEFDGLKDYKVKV